MGKKWCGDGAQRVGVPGSCSTWRSVTRAVPPGSLLGLVLFHIFIDDLEEAAECPFIKFAGDAKLWGAADTLQGRAAIAGDLDTLGEWADRSLMTFTKDKCQVLFPQTENLLQQCRLGTGRSYAPVVPGLPWVDLPTGGRVSLWGVTPREGRNGHTGLGFLAMETGSVQELP